ncbi:MAG: hypothetical protein ACOX8H_09095 [Ruminococcus sp.]|jgi:hypothetical protein
MNTDTLLFFEGHLDALPLYEKLEEQILSGIDNVRIKAQKSQISVGRIICLFPSWMKSMRK